MKTKELKQKAREMFDEHFPCIQMSCDNNGTIAKRISDAEWEPEQCQYCYTQRLPITSLIDQIIDMAVEETQKALGTAQYVMEKDMPQ